MIPLKIETLLEGRVVEQDRVEYKTGWNPNDIIHSICAFANDYDNTNGGYIVIGVKEKNGMPVFPLVGVQKENLDSIQQEIFQYCNMIVPRYIPKMEVVDYKNSGTFLIYLWCSAGDSGPYQAPKVVYAEKGEKLDKNLKYWIRPASLTTDAKQDEIMNVCMAEENDYLETHSGTFYPGVEKTFLQLKQEGYKLYIVSNCQDGYIQVMMKNGGLEKDITDFESNGRTGKFKADNICLLLERNGIPKEAAVYVGDTPMDEIATREAGLRFIHAAYGYGKAEAPDAVIGSIKELPEALREMKEGGKF